MKKLILPIILFLTVLLILSGCSPGNQITGQVVKETQTFKVGIVTTSEHIKNAVELANKELNFGLIYKDGKCNDPDASDKIKELETDNVNAIIGEACNEGEVLMLSISSNEESLTPNTIIGKQFLNRYKTQYEVDPTISAAEAFDAMMAIGMALESEEELTTAIKDVEFEGASGTFNQ